MLAQRVNPQQLQTMRELAPESVELLSRLFGAYPNGSGVKTHILIGTKTEDLEAIQGSGREEKVAWIVPKSAKPGDRALFFVKPHGLVAEAVFAGSPQKGGAFGRNPSTWRAPVHVVRIFQMPVAAATLTDAIPEWGWPTYPRSYVTVPERFTEKLWSLVPSLDNADAETSSTGRSGRDSGAGFGKRPNNALVEAAAVAFAWKTLASEGWDVTSVEGENRGFDLLCRKGQQELHVEVKGISGTECHFIITENELRYAKENGRFHLFAVTSALLVPRPHRMSGEDFVAQFRFEPIQYRARRESHKE